jgi:hypothetical protein
VSIREDSILFLLGAGASVDAGIKHAKQMTDDIEQKVQEDPQFKNFNNLYNYLKSSIIYQRGLEGNFSDQGATIENLLNVLSEINQKHNNTLYPFIGSWNVHLLKVAGDDFAKVFDLDKKIRGQLFKWINIRNYDDSDYFKNFGNLANEIGSYLRVFTLNYDLCVESALKKHNIAIELGFNSCRQWEASRFDNNPNTDTMIYLYKLHGSIDWIKEGNSSPLTKCDSPQESSELIFGTTAKLSSIDPYLFYVHEFRKYSLQEPLRLIVSIGYSFSDDYINKLISQSIMRNKFAKILTVSPNPDTNQERKRVSDLLNVSEDRIIHENTKAKYFFENKISLSYFEEIFGQNDDLPF